MDPDEKESMNAIEYEDEIGGRERRKRKKTSANYQYQRRLEKFIENAIPCGSAARDSSRAEERSYYRRDQQQTWMAVVCAHPIA